MDYVTLGNNIRKFRKQKGLLQGQLAELCNCSDSHIGQIERHQTVPSLEMIVRIANALDASVDQLICGSSNHPERSYLKSISERLDSYSISKRMRACEAIITYLDTLEKFSEAE